MNINIKKKTINEFLIKAFVLICVIFPGDIYNLKKILFFTICFFNYRLILKSIINRENKLIVFFGFIFPTLLFLYSSLLIGNIFEAFSRSFASYMFLIILVIINYGIDYEKIVIKSVKLIMISTIILVFLDISGVIDVNYGFFRNEIMYGYGLGLMGKSKTYSFYYKIFFRTSPLMVIPLFKNFNDSKYFLVIFALIALIISGTRANVLFPIIFLTAFYIFSTRNKSKLIKFTFIFITILFCVLFSSYILEKFNEVFTVRGEISDIVRQGHVEGIKELIKSDPWIIFRGSGMGSSFYSYGIDNMTSSIEWSYIDLWRQMGAGFFFLFLGFIITPLFLDNGKNKYKKYAYISYLCIAATNPLLFSSTSYLFYIYIYYDLNRMKKVTSST